jgi:hypothetical protein
MATLSAASNSSGRRYVIGIVVAHTLLLALLFVLSFRSSGPGPPFARLFLQTLLIAETCLLAIWVTFSNHRVAARASGLLLGIIVIVNLLIWTQSPGISTGELLGVTIELLVIPMAGVTIVLTLLRSLDFELLVPPHHVVLPALQPRISLLGLLSIMAVVAAMFALRPVVQSLAAFDRLSLFILLQTIALSSMTVAAIWTAFSAGSPWLRLLAFAAFVLAAAFFFGYLLVDGSYPFGVIYALMFVVAAPVVLVSLLCIRPTNLRCVTKTNGPRRIILDTMFSAALVGGCLSAMDFVYGKFKSGDFSNPFAFQTSTSDPQALDLPSAMREFLTAPSAKKLAHLLRLNGDATTVVDELAGLSGDSGTFETIASRGTSYIATIGRRKPKTMPGMREQFAYGNASKDAMVQYSTACFFDSEGHLLGKVGGRIAADGINGDDVSLTTLGTTDRWFVMVRRFEKHFPYDYQTEIRLVQPGFPTAFLLYHSPNSLSWTDTPESARPNPFFAIDVLPGGGRIPAGAKATAPDGNSYLPIFFWEADRDKFTGPSQLTYQGQPCFEVDLKKSSHFAPADSGSETSSK